MSPAFRAYSQSKGKSFEFGGLKWHTRYSRELSGPGNNFFGIDKRNVFIDKMGHLVLKIRKNEGSWSCAEVYSDAFLGYGKYEINVLTNTRHFTPQMVLGMFLYDASSPPHYNEIDIELAQWGNARHGNAQFAIHTGDEAEVYRFFIPEKRILARYLMEINDQNITLSCSVYNKKTGNYKVYAKQSFGMPEKFEFKNVRFHLNLWLTNTVDKNVGKNPEVKITSFSYTPVSN